MPFEMYQDVILLVDDLTQGLIAGDVGVVVDRHSAPGREDGYSVEFFDMTGRTVVVVTVPACHLRGPTSADRPTARKESRTVSA